LYKGAKDFIENVSLNKFQEKFNRVVV